jgi:cytochrome c peroxidase
MNSSSDVRRRVPGAVAVLAALAFGAAVSAQAPRHGKPAATQALVSLGEEMFKDVRLSSTGTMSCASCHGPDRAFTEDKPHAVGQNGIALGRNTPTLLGLASVDGFPVGGSFLEPPKMVPLEERVLAPLQDRFEMHASVDEAVRRLSKNDAVAAKFDVVFEEDREPSEAPAMTSSGVTAERLGAALAAYVRSLRHREGPSQLALAGSNIQLEAPVGRGLDLFRTEAKCQSCHSGPGLTDGKMHIVSPFRRPARVGTVVVEGSAGVRIRVAGGGHGYGENPLLERQTLPLVDVSRTSPYFRDGSVPTLPEAVRQHVAELRKVGEHRAAILGDPHLLLSDITSKAKTRRAIALSPATEAQLSSDDWIPPDLTAQQIDDLVAFLTSLSPGG